MEKLFSIENFRENFLINFRVILVLEGMRCFIYLLFFYLEYLLTVYCVLSIVLDVGCLMVSKIKDSFYC